MPRNPKTYHVYLLANNSGTLYIGMTNNLKRRILEHKAKRIAGFSARYNVTRLVWFQGFGEVTEAIEAEKQIKGWKREKKVALINEVNPSWQDLYDTL